MTDRYHSLTVVLERDMRDDDAEPILHAIRMIKGVVSVKGEVADPASFMAVMRARRELCEKLLDVIQPHSRLD